MQWTAVAGNYAVMNSHHQELLDTKHRLATLLELMHTAFRRGHFSPLGSKMLMHVYIVHVANISRHKRLALTYYVCRTVRSYVSATFRVYSVSLYFFSAWENGCRSLRLEEYLISTNVIH